MVSPIFTTELHYTASVVPKFGFQHIRPCFSIRLLEHEGEDTQNSVNYDATPRNLILRTLDSPQTDNQHCITPIKLRYAASW